MEQIIAYLILTKFHERKEDREKEHVQWIHTFFEELDDYHNQEKSFNKSHIWHTDTERRLCHICGMNITLSHTQEYLAKLHATLLLRLQAQERQREIEKHQRQQVLKAFNALTREGKEQDVVFAAYSYERSEARQVHAQKAGELWKNEDFTWCKIDHYCTGSTIVHIIEPIRTFRAKKTNGKRCSLTMKVMMFMQLRCLSNMED